MPRGRRRGALADRRLRARTARPARSTTRSRPPARPRCCSSTTPGGWSTTTRGTAAARSRTSSAASSTPPRPTRCSPSTATAACGSSTTAACTAARRTRRAGAGARLPPRPARGVEGQRGRARTCARAATRPRTCIAVGDSREDMETAAHVGDVLVRRQRGRARPDAARGDRRPRERARRRGGHGAGVYEAVVTTLASRGG